MRQRIVAIQMCVAVLVSLAVLLVAGCELSDLLPEQDNKEAHSTNSTPVVTTEVVSEPADTGGEPTESSVSDESSVATTEEAEAFVEEDSVLEPEATESTEMVENNPRYTPGEVEIPAEFLRHGAILELRYERCSLANGLLVHKSGYVYSIAPPSDPIWRLTDERGGKGIGTRARFADGTMYDGWVRDYTDSGPMPLVPPELGRGFAFWVKVE